MDVSLQIEAGFARASSLLPSIRILPWIGHEYEDRTRLLVLGESQYDPKKADHPEDAIRRWNIKLICEYAWGDRKGRFLTKIATLLQKDGRYAGKDTTNTFRGLAFYNYVQDMIPRLTSANLHQIAAAETAFEAMLATLEPEIILALGEVRLGGYLREFCRKRDWEVASPPNSQGPSHLGKTKVVWLPHPSSRFSYEDAKSKLQSQHQTRVES